MMLHFSRHRASYKSAKQDERFHYRRWHCSVFHKVIYFQQHHHKPVPPCHKFYFWHHPSRTQGTCRTYLLQSLHRYFLVPGAII